MDFEDIFKTGETPMTRAKPPEFKATIRTAEIRLDMTNSLLEGVVLSFNCLPLEKAAKALEKMQADHEKRKAYAAAAATTVENPL